MKKYLKAYLFYVKHMAKGIFRFPVYFDWREFGKEIHAITGSILVLFMCIVSILTYPVSVFVLAAIACEADRQTIQQRKKSLASRNRDMLDDDE